MFRVLCRRVSVLFLIRMHAGTVIDQAGKLVTSGGRILGVTALAGDFPAARQLAYAAADTICFNGKHYRKDIGKINDK